MFKKFEEFAKLTLKLKYNLFFQVQRLLSGAYGSLIDQVTIIDCRYPYEYQAGHIKVYGILQYDYVIYQMISYWPRYRFEVSYIDSRLKVSRLYS